MITDKTCPFCGEPLINDEDGYITCYECNRGDMSGSPDMWAAVETLIKQLHIAIDCMKACATRDHIGAICRTPQYVEKALQEINELGGPYGKIE